MWFAKLGTELICHHFCAGKDDTQKGGQEGESGLKLQETQQPHPAWVVENWLSKERLSTGTAPQMKEEASRANTQDKEWPGCPKKWGMKRLP